MLMIADMAYMSVGIQMAIGILCADLARTATCTVSGVFGILMGNLRHQVVGKLAAQSAFTRHGFAMGR
jgi:hypothetical protein